MTLARLAATLVARPRASVAVWLSAVLVAVVAGATLGGQLSPTSLVVPGNGADRAQSLDRERFGAASTEVVVMVRGSARRVPPAAARVVRALRELPQARIAVAKPRPGVALLGVRVPYRSGSRNDRMEAEFRRAAALAGPGMSTAVTGPGIVGRGLEDEALSSVSAAERVALPILLIVLLLVFRSVVAAAVPLLVGVATVSGAHGLVSLIARLTSLDVFAVTLASLIGLALGIDYSLLLVSRFREELAAGVPPPEAARRTAASSGHTVAVAAFVLGVALAVALMLAPGGILLSTVVGTLAAVVFAALGALVGLPALLALIGPRINAWRIGRGSAGTGLASRLVNLSRRPVLVITAVTVALLTLSGAALGLETGPPDASQLSADNPIRRNVDRVSSAAGAGWTSSFLVVAAGKPGGFSSVDAAQWQRELAAVPGVQAAVPEVDRRGSAIRVTVVGPAGANAPQSRDLHQRLLATATGFAQATGAEVVVGGQPAEFAEFSKTLADRAPLLVAAVAVAGGITLAILFGSPVLAVVTIVLNLLTVGAAFGAVALFFGGSAPPLGGPGFVDAISLLAAYTIVFGLSIDYQVFLIASMREARRSGASAAAVVERALRDTGLVVSGAAAIMTAVFVAFAFAEMAAIRQLGTVLAIAIVLDATVVRLALLPAVARVLGDRLWWPPKAPRRPIPGRALGGGHVAQDP